MKKLIIILMMLIILPACTAEVQTLGTTKSTEDISLIQSCVNSTYSNITRITYPNKTFAINAPTAMTKNGHDYNYTFDDTEAIGQFLVYGVCDENGVDTTWVYDFFVSGKGGSSNVSFIYFLILCAAGLLYYGVKTSNEYGGFLSGLLFMVGAVYILIYGFGGMSDIYTRAVAFVLLGLGMMIGTAAGYKVYEGAEGW